MSQNLLNEISRLLSGASSNASSPTSENLAHSMENVLKLLTGTQTTSPPSSAQQSLATLLEMFAYSGMTEKPDAPSVSTQPSPAPASLADVVDSARSPMDILKMLSKSAMSDQDQKEGCMCSDSKCNGPIPIKVNIPAEESDDSEDSSDDSEEEAHESMWSMKPRSQKEIRAEFRPLGDLDEQAARLAKLSVETVNSMAELMVCVEKILEKNGMDSSNVVSVCAANIGSSVGTYGAKIIHEIQSQLALLSLIHNATTFEKLHQLPESQRDAIVSRLMLMVNMLGM